jgi:hypothetical protein
MARAKATAKAQTPAPDQGPVAPATPTTAGALRARWPVEHDGRRYAAGDDLSHLPADVQADLRQARAAGQD